MSRGPVPQLNYLERIVRTISEFKLNQLYMYIEDSFRLDGQPLVDVLSDTLSRDDWKELVAYAAQRHVDIIPATEACGHLHKISAIRGVRPSGRATSRARFGARQSPVFRVLGKSVRQSTNGRLEDLRDYTTRLRELYKELWLKENLPTWLPNMLQLYDRQIALWQELIAKFAEIQLDQRRGKSLPPAESLGLLPSH